MAARGPGRDVLARVTLCAVCPREGRGFGYCHRLRWDRHAFHRFCSRRCQEIGGGLAERNHGMIDKTAREGQAIRDARRPFAEALADLGLMEPFFHRSPAEIDRLIEAAVTGYIDSMQQQAARKERSGFLPDNTIPF